MRARPGLGASGGPGTPDITGPHSPGTGADGLPFRVRPPRGPGSSDIAAHDPVILSDHDQAVIRKAIALARRDGKDDWQDAAAGQHGPGRGPSLPADESRAGWPAEPRWSAPSPAVTQAVPAASPAPPSWGTVLANTIRLRTARWRFWPATTRWRLTSALILAAVLLCAGVVTVALTRGTTAGKGAAGSAQPAGAGPAGTGAANDGQPPGQAAIAAAVWMVRQVDPAAVVACDPRMCAVLQSKGIAAARLLVLGAGEAGPLGSDVIVSTAAVREEFGSRLTSVYAPVALATFGSGSAQVAVRVVAADGSAGYLRSLHADVSARRAVGALLLRNPHVRVSPAGRRALAAGQVDTRLLSAIGALATPYHVHITGFGAPAAGASPGVPLRSAEISPTPARRGQDARLDSVKRFLLAQRTPFRPADVTTVRLASGQTVLHVEFTAPSPLGLLGAP
jgi:hypothetical protein